MRLLGLILLCALSFGANAQIESVINFHGQNSEVMKIEKDVNVVRPVAYEVPDTCTRDVPYQSYECRDVTRYRQECSWIPESERCWNETDRVCRPVTRTRQECSNGPSRQVCTQRPSRQVCTERPTRQVCRTDSSGQQRCQTVGGGQSCQTVGGGQSCSTVPGERTCRTVSYTDQDCDNVTRRRCERVPGRNDCRDIPYSENVCGYETRYNQESYACTRTEYRDETTPKKLTGAVNVHFVTNGLVEEFPLSVAVVAHNPEFRGFVSNVKLNAEPKVFVILKKNELKIAQETEKEITLEGDVVIEVLEEQMVTPVFPVIKKAAFNESTSVLSLPLEGGISPLGSIEMLFKADPMIGRKKTIAELKSEYPSERVNIKETNLEINLKGIMKTDLKKKNHLSVKLTAPLSIQGELLNAKKPILEKSYKFEVRK